MNYIAPNISRENNFDLLRLYAAIEVMFFHIFPNMGTNVDNLRWIQGGFNGVMIFYFISGFLITNSYLHSKSLKQYAKNRILRLTPALICVYLFTIIIIMLRGDFEWYLWKSYRFWIWSFMQTTIFPGYRDGLFPNFANGEENGSLWTISTEIFFYCLIPIVFRFCKKRAIWAIISIFICSVILNHNYHTFSATPADGIFKMYFWRTPIPYLWNFLVGSIFCLYWSKLKKIIEGKFLYYFIAYLFLIWCGVESCHTIRTPLTLYSNIFLGFVVLSAAYTKPKSAKILHGVDISYGVYVYHIVIQNLFIDMGLTGWIGYPIMVFILSIIIGYLSWHFIESKALSMKKANIKEVLFNKFRR